MSEKVRMTFSIPDDLKESMDAMPEVNWPEVIKRGIIKRLEVLEELRAEGRL